MVVNPTERGANHLFRGHMDAFIPNPADFGKHVNGNNFWNLSGLLQESLLTYWLEVGDFERIRATRTDFQIDIPLTDEELETTLASQEIIRRPEPIFRLGNDPQLSIITDLAYAPVVCQRMSLEDFRSETKGILIREKERLMHFYPGRFSPAEDIGSISAARRYLAILSSPTKTANSTITSAQNLVFARSLAQVA